MNLLKKTILSIITLSVLLIPASPAFAASEQGLAHGKGNGLTKTTITEQTSVTAGNTTVMAGIETPTTDQTSPTNTSTQNVTSIHTNTPKGNNGTIKIHEAGTPAGTENNDPKVCSFNVEGFGFDANQSGYLQFTVQGGDKPTGTNAGPYSFGPTNLNGFYASQYFSLSKGHYKATLYGKMLPGGQLSDIKAKSKVFKVSCEKPVVNPVTITPTPTNTDQNGQVLSASTTKNDPTPALANTGQGTFVASLMAVNVILASLLLAIRNKKPAEAKKS